MGTLWPKSGMIERDNNDDRAIGALAYFYVAGTTTPKAVYQDGGETTPYTQPVTADGNGRWPSVFVPYGSYKETRTTSGGAAIGVTLDNIPNPAPFDDTITVDPESLYATGHVSVGLGNETRAGFVRCNGRTIGNAASSATERANADTSDLFVHIWNRYADAQAPVSGGRGASASADFGANKRLTLPDWRGLGIFGFDDMGSTARVALGSAPVVTGDTVTPGSVLGSNIHTLTTSQLPSHTHTGTTQGATLDHTHVGTAAAAGGHAHTASSGSGGAHTHTVTVNAGTQATAASGFSPFQSGVGTTLTSSSDGAHTHTVTVDAVSDHTHVVTTTGASQDHAHLFTTDASGSGSAHNNLPGVALVTFYIKL